MLRLRAEGATYHELAERFQISLTRVGQIIHAERAKMPLRDRAEIIKEHAAELDRGREILREIAERPGPVATGNSKDGPVELRSIDGNPVEDVTGKVEALRALTVLQTREAKLLGLDSPDRVASTEVVTVRFEGIDPDKDL